MSPQRPLPVLLLSITLLSCQNSTRPKGVKQTLAEADRLAWLYNWQKAGPLYADAEKMSAGINDRRDELYARCGRLRAGMESGSPAETSEYLAKELENPIVSNDPRLMLRCLASKGDVDREDNPESARRAWEKALDIAKSLNDGAWQARAKAELGIVAFLDGDITKSKDLIGSALLSALARGDLPTMVIYGSQVCNGMVEMGRADDGLGWCEKALTVAHTIKDMGFPFLAYAGKARALVLLGREAEARGVLEEALVKTRQLDLRLEQSQALIVLGKQWAAAGDRQKAIQYFEQAGELSRTNGFEHSIAWSMFEAAKVYGDAGDLPRAEDRATQAMRAMEQVGDKYHLPLHFALLAELKTRRGKFGEADELYDKAADVIEGLLINSPNEQLKASLIASMSDIYREHFALAADHFRDTAKAFTVIEQARGRGIEDALRGVSIGRGGRSPTQDVAEREVTRLQLRLVHSTTRDERTELLDRLFEAEQVLTAPVGASGDNRQTSTFSLKPIELAKLRRGLRSDELLLEYILAEPKSFCLSITRERAEISALPAGKGRIEGLVESYLGEIKSKAPGVDKATELYSLLLGPVPGGERKLRWIIVPDGALHLLPFDSLRDATSKYVLESHVVTNAPSASVLYSLRTTRPAHEPTLTFLGIGDVPYEDPPKLLADNSGRILNTSGGLRDLSGARLQNLPGSRREVVTASEALGGKTVLLLGQRATEFAFKSEPVSDFKIIHLAVHGFSSDQFPERAALVLAVDAQGHDDGLLQAREIRALPLNADLVTLSACDTGRGRLLGEEGIANLERAFLLAGAKTVVASLWTADDTYTLALMKRFYLHLAEKQDKGTALRQAKIELLSEFGAAAVPFYWSGLNMVGDGSIPIQVNINRPVHHH